MDILSKISLLHWLRNHSYVAVWIQSIVVIVGGAIAYFEYEQHRGEMKSIHSLEYTKLFFNSESLKSSRMNLGEDLDHILEGTVDAEEPFKYVYNNVIKKYDSDLEFRNDFNTFFAFLDSVIYCSKIYACDNESVNMLTAGFFNQYYMYMVPIVVCRFSGFEDQFHTFFIEHNHEEIPKIPYTQDYCKVI